MPATSIPTLAFGFVSPWLLWGLLLGGVPILIQWLHRRNYTQRVWAAMRFVRAATKAQSRRLRFESLLLLAIRALILLLVALALAQPFLESSGWLPQAPASVHRMLVIDTSLSLQHEVEGRPISQRARDAARRIINGSQPGDSVQVVTIGRQGRALVRQPAYDAGEVLAQIDGLSWTEEFGDAGQALRLAQRLLSEAPEASRTELVLISDFQRSNWWPQTPTERSRLQRLLAELSEIGELSLIHVGQPDAGNAAISQASLAPLPVTLDESVEITAEVAASGSDVDKDVMVELVENDRVLQTARTGADSGSGATVTLPMRWREAGWHGLELRLPADGLEADNHHWLAIEVRDELDVLLVNGRESGERLGRATDFVELALAPASSSAGQSVMREVVYRPVVVSEAELSRTDLSGFDGIFLCDVPFLSETEQARLRTYVRGGGGLIIAAGPQMQPAAWTGWLADGPEPLLAVDLLDVAGSDDPEEPFRFADLQSQASPIVEPFVGNPQAGLTTANVYRYVRTVVRESSHRAENATTGDDNGSRGEEPPALVRVPLRFTNGDPAILESDYGAGRVLLVTTSLDDQWGSWALWPSFLPMMHRLVDHATAGGVPTPALVGDVVRREYPVESLGLSATLQLPDGRRQGGQVRVDQGVSLLQLDELSQSGLYRILLGPPLNRTELLAVNVDPRESDLRLLDQRELQGTLLNGISARLVSGTAPVAAAGPEDSPPSVLSRWLLIVAFVLLLVEQTMAWNPRWGLIGLCASPIAVTLFALWPTLTIVLLAVSLTGVILLRWWRASAV